MWHYNTYLFKEEVAFWNTSIGCWGLLCCLWSVSAQGCAGQKQPSALVLKFWAWESSHASKVGWRGGLGGPGSPMRLPPPHSEHSSQKTGAVSYVGSQQPSSVDDSSLDPSEIGLESCLVGDIVFIGMLGTKTAKLPWIIQDISTHTKVGFIWH